MKIAVDVMGTDYGPSEIMQGTIDAVNDFGCKVILVGDEKEIENILDEKKTHALTRSKISICHADEVIDMHEYPSVAVRKKKNASVVLATKLLKEGKCQAVISPGSTGAAVAAALLGLGRIAGIERPVIATPIPNKSGTTVVVDSGANVDSKPQHMAQAAIMGSLYARHVLQIKNPRVGLLNIGEEETKGNEQAQATYPLLRRLKSVNFIGNAEGRDVTNGKVDVVVCDGFVGNILLKFAEGLAVVIMQLLRETIKRGGILTKIAALLMFPALRALRKKIDVAEYGGAPLLGVNGTFIICHGSSKARDIRNAVRVAIEFNNNNLLEHIKTAIVEAKEA
ncbi:MAG: phosphate acyltransferase PlsX [Acidaminococcales bacterium]|jgi:glycerol-3-phosphate acyltransferase PlsX|nr:phosphate acyltransferase PlsX [Acidaminococcales bacterium]